MKKRLFTILIVLTLLSGLSLILYPAVSDFLNQAGRTRDIKNYASSVSAIDAEEYGRLWSGAEEYNAKLAQKPAHWKLSQSEINEYESQLNVSGSGVMAYVEIPKLGCSLPVYHGTSADVLQIAVGHLEGSSLPVGGKSTHCVLSGHRGLPSAKLFTDIDQLQEGDKFLLQMLDRTLTYEVDQIRIVLPQELQDLEIDPNQDYVTLITCTPYGVNTHRLLVRGHRVDNDNTDATRITADAMRFEPVIVAPLVAAPILFILLIILLVSTSNWNRKRKRHRSKSELKGVIEQMAEEDAAGSQDTPGEE
jgi:sortase A